MSTKSSFASPTIDPVEASPKRVAWLTTGQCADVLGVRRGCVQYWIATGKLTAWRSPAGTFLIDPAVIGLLITAAHAARSASNAS